MTDAQMEEIYAFGRDAFRGGQTEFQIQAFPFRMTAENMARYRNDPNYEFWKMLKEGYDHFEITKVPPKVDVCEKRYVFNQVAEAGATFDPTGACPVTTQPDSLKMAYQSYQTSYAAAFSSATGSSKTPAPKPTIAGTKEAALVSEWTKRRARGERVSMEPPSMAQDGSVSVTSRMGRIDSPAGRKIAAAEAAAEAKKKAAAEKLAAKQRAAEEKAAAVAAAKAAQEAPVAAAPVPQPAEAAQTVEAPMVGAPPAEQPGILGNVRKKIGNLFGG
jgi:hypothetical protein